MSYVFENAQELAKQYPDTFEAPNEEELDDLRIGDYVKICVSSISKDCIDERFWCVVTKVRRDQVVGIVDNELMGNWGLKLGDHVSFNKENIYCIEKKEN